MEFDKDRRKVCVGLGAVVLTLASTIPNIAYGDEAVIVSEERPGLVDHYDSIMEVWYTNVLNQNGHTSEQRLTVHRNARKSLMDIVKRIEAAKKGKDSHYIGEDARPDVRFTPYLSTAVSLLYEAYETIGQEGLTRIADGDPETIDQAVKLHKVGSPLVMASKGFAGMLVKINELDFQSSPSMTSMAWNSSKDYWDILYKVDVASKYSSRDTITHPIVKLLIDKFPFPDREKHFPLDVLYKQ